MLLIPEYKKKIIAWIVAVLIPAVVVPTVYFCTSFGLSNTFLLPGVIYLAGCGLVFVVRCGVFDLFSYQFVNFWYSWARRAPKKYDDVLQYRETHEEKRKRNPAPYLPFLSIGILLVVLAIIFAFVKI